MERALRERVIVIKEGASNKAFLLELLNSAEVERAEADIGLVGDRKGGRRRQPLSRVSPTWRWCRRQSNRTLRTCRSEQIQFYAFGRARAT